MIHIWDQQIMRLCRHVDQLEEQNAKLREMLTDAIRICDEALTAGRGEAPDAGERARSSSRIANFYRLFMSQLGSTQWQLRLPWRSVMLLSRRRKVEPAVRWPFEPVVGWRFYVGSAGTSLSKDQSHDSLPSVVGKDEEHKTRKMRAHP
jgi:hypothetical protein